MSHIARLLFAGSILSLGAVGGVTSIAQHSTPPTAPSVAATKGPILKFVGEATITYDAAKDEVTISTQSRCAVHDITSATVKAYDPNYPDDATMARRTTYRYSFFLDCGVVVLTQERTLRLLRGDVVIASSCVMEPPDPAAPDRKIKPTDIVGYFPLLTKKAGSAGTTATTWIASSTREEDPLHISVRSASHSVWTLAVPAPGSRRMLKTSDTKNLIEISFDGQSQSERLISADQARLYSRLESDARDFGVQ